MAWTGLDQSTALAGDEELGYEDAKMNAENAEYDADIHVQFTASDVFSTGWRGSCR